MWLLNNAIINRMQGTFEKIDKVFIPFINHLSKSYYVTFLHFNPVHCLISKCMEEIAIFYTKKSLLKMRTHIYLCVVILRLVRRFSIPCGARRWRFARGSLSVLFLLACEPRAKAFKHVNGKSLRRWPFHKENRRKYGYLLTDCLATKSYFRKS